MSKKEDENQNTGNEKTERKGIQVEKIVSPGEAIKYLEEIAGYLKKGKLVIVQGDDCFALTPPETDTVKLKIEIKQKKAKGKLEIAMTWQQMAVAEPGEDLIVSDTEPAAPETHATAVKTAKKPGKSKTACIAKKAKSKAKPSTSDVSGAGL